MLIVIKKINFWYTTTWKFKVFTLYIFLQMFTRVQREILIMQRTIQQQMAAGYYNMFQLNQNIQQQHSNNSRLGNLAVNPAAFMPGNWWVMKTSMYILLTSWIEIITYYRTKAHSLSNITYFRLHFYDHLFWNLIMSSLFSLRKRLAIKKNR